MFEKTLIIVVS